MLDGEKRDHAYITADIGINQNGDLSLAKKLINAAAVADCDAVKFQKRTVDTVYTQEYLASPRKSPWGEIQRAQKEGLEFGKDGYDEIDRYCRRKGIEWYASAWDVGSQKFLRQYDCKYNKVASAMLTNMKLLEEIAVEGKYMFIAADAQHIATEFISRFYKERPGLNADALTMNTSTLMAAGNDYGYERMFARQLEAKAEAGDMAVGISTSGRSVNVLEGLRYACRNGLATVLLTD